MAQWLFRSFPILILRRGNTVCTVGLHLPVQGMDFLPRTKQTGGLNSLTGKKTKEAERLRRYTHEVKTEEHDKDSEEKTILPVHSKHNSVCSKIINASSTFVIICSSPFDRFPQTCYNHASKRSICLLSIYSVWCSFSGYYVSHSALVPHQCFSSWHQWMH